MTALLIVFVLWAGIFLPGLGSAELKGEEGRRIMPAVTMLDGGSWVVPYVGGKPFLRKPPLVQWCMAGSMNLFGRNPWAARLPSVLGVLALAIVMVLATQGWLITEESLVAAIVMMTQVSTIEKCRLAELEAVYVALSGIAMVLWLSGWARGVSPWKLWVVPMALNGLALLAKAPLHLLFFYAIVVAVLLRERKLRSLFHPAHLVGLLVMAGIVAAWAVPYFREVAASDAGRVWQRQFVERVTGAEMDVGKYLMNVPNGLGNHLPWVLFAPLLWMRGVNDTMYPRGCSVLSGARNAVAICFFVLLLIPGVLPRYVQPLVAPFSLILAPVLWNCPRTYRHWWRYGAFGLTFVLFLGALAGPFVVAAYNTRGFGGPPVWLSGLAILVVIGTSLCLMQLRRKLHGTLHLTVWTGLIAAMAIILMSTIAAPMIREKDDIRPFAEAIDEKLNGQRLLAFDLDDYAPLLAVLFYLEGPFDYVPDATAAPKESAVYLVRGKDKAKFAKKFHIMEEMVPPLLEKDAIVVRAMRK